MTDKVQKIRDEVERLYNQSLADENRQAELGLKSAACTSYGKSKACNELISFIDSLQDEPVSEDLEDFALQYAGHHAPYDDCMQEVGDAFKAGAKWQKEQFEKNRLKHCNSITNEQAELEQGFIDQHLDKHQRMPTFLDAIEYGMNLQKEQMIKNAVDGVVAASAGGDGWVNIATGFVKSKDVNVKFGDKIKIIVVKED